MAFAVGSSVGVTDGLDEDEGFESGFEVAFTDDEAVAGVLVVVSDGLREVVVFGASSVAVSDDLVVVSDAFALGMTT